MRAQRWNGRRWTWAREDAARPELYGVEPITRDVARAFVELHHYSGSWPSCLEAVGLWRAEPFTPGLLKLPELVGVAVFGNPGNEDVLPTRAAVGPRDGADLARFACVDAVELGGETIFLRGAFSVIRGLRPEWRAIVAYSDPVMRRGEDGRVILPGHVGIIYQAHNGIYTGRASRRRLRLLPDGTALSERTRAKIRRHERGHEYASRQLEAATGLKRLVGESGESYLARVDASPAIRFLSHPGNHAYVWPLVDEAREGIASAALGRPRAEGEGVSRFYRQARESRAAFYPKQIEDIKGSQDE